MQIDKKQLRQIADIDIKTFENMIYNAVISSGGNPGQAKAAVMAAPIIKSKLAKQEAAESLLLVQLPAELWKVLQQNTVNLRLQPKAQKSLFILHTNSRCLTDLLQTSTYPKVHLLCLCPLLQVMKTQ